MNRYLKLVHLEIHRFRHVLFGLMGLTAVVQFAAMFVYIRNEVARRNNYIEEFGFLRESFDKMSFARASQEMWSWFALPVALSIAVLLFYVFFIWYRDWFGRNTFVYRLLALPTARRNVYLAKLTALLTFVFGLLACQLILLPIEKWAFTLAVPANFAEASSIAEAIEVNSLFALLLPRNFEFFLLSYGIGIMALLAAFAAILLERSYRRAGIALGVLYIAACAAVVAIPASYYAFVSTGGYFYPEEVFGFTLLAGAAVCAASVWLGFRLLAKKVTV